MVRIGFDGHVARRVDLDSARVTVQLVDNEELGLARAQPAGTVNAGLELPGVSQIPPRRWTIPSTLLAIAGAPAPEQFPVQPFFSVSG